jgi:hypothetical protein
MSSLTTIEKRYGITLNENGKFKKNIKKLENFTKKFVILMIVLCQQLMVNIFVTLLLTITVKLLIY